MSNEEQKRVAYELTLEYIRQNNLLRGNIASAMNMVEKVYNEIYQNLTDKKIL